MKANAMDKMKAAALPLATRLAACAVALVLAMGMAPAPAAAATVTAGSAKAVAQEQTVEPNPDGTWLWHDSAGSTPWKVGGQQVRCKVHLGSTPDETKLYYGPKSGGKNIKFNAGFYCTAKHGAVAWTSSDPKVATVNPNGVITLVGKGKFVNGTCKTVIRATTVVAGATIHADFTVKVNNPKLKKQKLKNAKKGVYRLTVKKSALEKGPVTLKVRPLKGNKTKLTYELVKGETDLPARAIFKFDGKRGTVTFNKDTHFYEVCGEKRYSLNLVVKAKQTNKYMGASKRVRVFFRVA